MKELVVVGGANGTGKTTFSLAYARLRSIPHFGADAIAEEMAPGHDVPEPDIRRRSSRSIRNFWGSYRLLADAWVSVDNGGDSAIDAAAGTGSTIIVRDEQRFAMFQVMAGVERHE